MKKLLVLCSMIVALGFVVGCPACKPVATPPAQEETVVAPDAPADEAPAEAAPAAAE